MEGGRGPEPVIIDVGSPMWRPPKRGPKIGPDVYFVCKVSHGNMIIKSYIFLAWFAGFPPVHVHLAVTFSFHGTAII